MCFGDLFVFFGAGICIFSCKRCWMYKCVHDDMVGTLVQEDAAECFTVLLTLYDDTCKQQIEGNIIIEIILK